MKISILCLLLFLAGYVSAEVQNFKEKWQHKTFDEIKDFLDDGEIRGFFSLEEVTELFNGWIDQFPELVSKTKIGESFEKREMFAYKISLSTKPEDPTLLFTGAHHSREPLGVSMIMYLATYLIHSYINNHKEMINYLKSRSILIIPIVNIDSYELIGNKYKADKKLTFYRKNRRTFNCLNDVEVGVDLNRNYGFKFGFDDIGSSGQQCAEDYRGPEAFSEPETQAVKFAVENTKTIKMAYNLHAWGNLFIIPYTYLKDRNNSALENDPRYAIYKEIKEEADLPHGDIFGSAMQAIQYSANGETSDWMFGEHGIIAASPELGTNNKLTDDFFPPQNVIMSILDQNIGWILYSIKKIGSQIDFNVTGMNVLKCDETMFRQGGPTYEHACGAGPGYKLAVNLTVKNKGLSPMKNKTITFTYPDFLTYFDEKGIHKNEIMNPLSSSFDIDRTGTLHIDSLGSRNEAHLSLYFAIDLLEFKVKDDRMIMFNSPEFGKYSNQLGLNVTFENMSFPGEEVTHFYLYMGMAVVTGFIFIILFMLVYKLRSGKSSQDLVHYQLENELPEFSDKSSSPEKGGNAV